MYYFRTYRYQDFNLKYAGGKTNKKCCQQQEAAATASTDRARLATCNHKIIIK
jgi:hypothetical protein